MSDDLPVPRGPLYVFLAVVVGVAVIGFVTGTDVDDYDLDPLPVSHEEVAAAELPHARSYAELQRAPRGSSSGWAADVAPLDGPGLMDPVQLDGTDKAEALADRAALRAYDGAPPRIPHAVRQGSAAECLACHQDGMRIRGHVAPKMSHQLYASCTQCHVVDEAPMPPGEIAPDPRDVPNSFAGLPAPTQGPRAWNIAPPQIPHKTFMRERCDSCHGPNGRDAIRSSHPYRQSCTQCHAPSAELDQRPALQE